MSEQCSSMGGFGGMDYLSMRQQMQDIRQNGMSKDQLSDMQSRLKGTGKDTSNLDKILDNFDTLDTDGNGKVSLEELKAQAEKLGIQLPKGGRHHHELPALSSDQLNDLIEQLKSKGRDTTDLEKIANSFDKLDTDGDGKVSFQEMQAGSQQIGIHFPEGPQPPDSSNLEDSGTQVDVFA